MKHKSTLILIIAVAIAALVAYSLSKKPTTEEIQQQRQKMLAGFDSGDVRTLTIDSGEQRIACERLEGDDTWRITEPVQVRADRWEVQGILDRFEMAEKASTVIPQKGRPLKLADYGLDQPVRKVTMSEKPGGRTWTVLIGRSVGVADTVYVAVQGEDLVYTVSKDVVDRADVTLADLRSKRLAPRISSFDLTKVGISAVAVGEEPAFQAQCEKSGKQWEFKDPFHDLADGDKIERMASKLYDHHLAEDDFAVDDPTEAAQYGLDKPALTLSLASEEKSQTVILSRKQEGKETRYYAMLKGEPAIVRVPQSLFDELRQTPTDLRERSLVDVVVSDVAEVTLSGPGAELVLKRDGDGWRIEGDEPVAADRDVTEALIRDLKAARIESFADDADDLAPYGLTDEAKTSAALKDTSGKILGEIAFGGLDETGESAYAMRPPYPAVLSLKADGYLERVKAGRLAFLDRLILDEPRVEAVEVTVRRAGTRQRCTREEGAERWDLVEPIQGRADQWAVGDILADFASLRAEAFAGEQAEDLSRYGLDEPPITVTVSYAAKPSAPDEPPARRVRTIHVGSPAEQPAETRYAKLEDQDRVFTLGEHVVQRLSADLASKMICEVSDLVGLTFTKAGERHGFSFAPDERAWTDGEGGKREDVDAVARLLEDLKGVKVADYTEKSPAHYGFDDPFLVIEIEQETAKGKRIVVGKEAEDGSRYVKGPATGFIHIVSEADVAALCAPLESQE